MYKLEKPLVFIQCLKLLELCVQNGLVVQDPNPDNDAERKDNILVYRAAGTDSPEGWYSENIHSTAQELMRDMDSQQFLLNELEKASIPLSEIFDVLQLLDDLQMMQDLFGDD